MYARPATLLVAPGLGDDDAAVGVADEDRRAVLLVEHLCVVSTSLSSESVWFCTTLTLKPSAVSRS